MPIERSLPAAHQQELLERLTQILRQEPRIEAAWLAGSLGRGDGDQFSDVDILALVATGAAAPVSADLVKAIEANVSPALLNVLFGGRVLNAVTEDWRRFDISFVEGEELSRQDANALRPLFNRNGQQPPARPPREYLSSPDTLLKLVQEFLRVLGLAVVCAGRGEHVLMLDGVGLLRKMTVDLMLEENRIAPELRGGTLRRNPLLNAEQRAELTAAPPLVATRDSALAGSRYFATIFLSRAHRLASDIGVAWPHAFEQATRDSLERNLGLRLPPA